MRYLGNINITVRFFLFWCWNFVTRFFIHIFIYYTALVFILDFFRQISHNFKNQEQNNLIFIATLISLLVFFQNGKTEYNYVNVLSNIVMPLFLIEQSNLTHSLFFQIFTSHWNNARVLARFYLQQVPGLINWRKFGFSHPTVWEIYFPLLS